MKFTILVEILFELLAKRKVTAGYIATKYDISIRTVYRYVDYLSLCVPLVIKKGRDGGICIPENYKLPSGFMTKEEYEAAIEALETMYSQLPEERFLAAKRKLSAQVKAEMRELSSSGEMGTILVDGSSWGDTGAFADKVRFIEECIRGREVLEIDYRSKVGECSKRMIEPHMLVFKQRIWYVFAYCKKQQDFRLFRLGRIFSSELTGEKFTPKPFTRNDIPLGFWINQTESVDLVLEIKESAFVDVQDWLGGEHLKKSGNCWLTEITLPNDDYLIKKLVGLGSGVTVKSPSQIREAVKKEASKIAALY